MRISPVCLTPQLLTTPFGSDLSCDYSLHLQHTVQTFKQCDLKALQTSIGDEEYVLLLTTELRGRTSPLINKLAQKLDSHGRGLVAWAPNDNAQPNEIGLALFVVNEVLKGVWTKGSTVDDSGECLYAW